ncbi:MAG: ferredoxin [Candidatus Aenigmarchaeota archaeon]|nr:ferredoxin [Candidatus Aenigmarchaeota archaeon]
MTQFKIEHDRPGCIGCGACAALAPQFWTMDPADGKSDLLQAKKTEEGGEVVKEERDIDQKDLDMNMSAAQSCPVNVIHLKDIGKNEKLI